MRTYHVQAIGVANFTNKMAPKPAATPAIAAHSPGFLVSTPSRKTPSSAPAGIDPMVKPASSTDFDPLAPIAITNSTAPHATVARRAVRIELVWKISTTTVDASEFNAALKLAIAAARIAAISSPARPGGRLFQMNSG